MNKQHVFILCFLIVYGALAQDKKYQWKVDLLATGIGIETYKPNLGNNLESSSPWVGADILFSGFNFGFAQGTVSPLIGSPFFSGFSANMEQRPIRFSRFYAGINMPVPILTFGEYTSWNKVFRGTPVVKANIGYHASRIYSLTDVTRGFSFQFSPGYRVRIPLVSIDFSMNFTSMGEITSHPEEIKSWLVYPSITLRFDGLYDAMNVRFNQASATNFSVNNYERKERTYTNLSGQRMRETTTSYSVSSSPTTVTMTDIGNYAGLGIRVSRSGVNSRLYSNPGTLIGAHLLVRSGILVGGLNLEAGRIGHASELQTFGEKYHRRPNKYEDYGAGTINTINLYADFGGSLNNFLMGMAGTLVDDEESTPYFSINAGVSFGLNAMFGQKFDDPEIASNHYDNLENRSYFNDPREMGGGFMGGLFLSCDIGNASFRATWYRYRRAPLANNLMFSVAWRLGGSD